MIRSISFLLLFAALAGNRTASAADDVWVSRNAQTGEYIILDPDYGVTYVTRNPVPIIQVIAKRGKVIGFGNQITQKQFQTKEATPTQQATQQATGVARLGLNDLNRIPGSSIVVRPVQRLLSAINSAATPRQ